MTREKKYCYFPCPLCPRRRRRWSIAGSMWVLESCYSFFFLKKNIAYHLRFSVYNNILAFYMLLGMQHLEVLGRYVNQDWIFYPFILVDKWSLIQFWGFRCSIDERCLFFRLNFTDFIPLFFLQECRCCCAYKLVDFWRSDNFYCWRSRLWAQLLHDIKFSIPGDYFFLPRQASTDFSSSAEHMCLCVINLVLEGALV